MQSQKGPVRFYVISIVLLALLNGCAAPKITMCKLVPGTVTEASRLKKIAVVPFDGTYGPEFAAELESSLANIRVNDAPFYQVVNRNAIDKVLAEQAFSVTGVVNPRSAVKLGNLLGAQGLYVGQITTASHNTTPYKESRRECVQADKKGRCKAWRDYTVNCLKRTAQLTVVPQLIDVQTGKICYSDTFDATDESTGCSDTTAPTNGDQMLTQLRGTIIQKLRLAVAPHTEFVQVKLLTDADDIPSEPAKQKLKQGMAFAESGRMNRACEIWEEASPLAPSSISYLHNLAVCAEMTGDLEKAHAMLSDADKKLLKPNDIISASLARVQIEAQRKKKLREQMSGHATERRVVEAPIRNEESETASLSEAQSEAPAPAPKKRLTKQPRKR